MAANIERDSQSPFAVMRNIILQVCIQTVRPLGTTERLAAFVELLKRHPVFIPKRYWIIDSKRPKFEIERGLDQLVACQDTYGGLTSFTLAPPLAGSMGLFTSRGGPLCDYNKVSLKLDYSVGNLPDRLGEILAFFTDAVSVFDAAYGSVSLTGGNTKLVRKTDENGTGELDGHVVLPCSTGGIRELMGIWWVNVFGKEYIEFFGRSTLEKMPGWHAGYWPDPDHFWLQTTSRPEELVTPAGQLLADEIKRLLGKPKAFFGYSMDPFVLVDHIYDRPDFDYTEIRDRSFLTATDP